MSHCKSFRIKWQDLNLLYIIRVCFLVSDYGSSWGDYACYSLGFRALFTFCVSLFLLVPLRELPMRMWPLIDQEPHFCLGKVCFPVHINNLSPFRFLEGLHAC